MQRIRRLRDDTRLSISQGTDIFNFDQSESGVYVALRESAVNTLGRKVLTVMGKDNVRDFGEWFASKSSTEGDGSFISHTGEDKFRRFGAITQPTEIYKSELDDSLGELIGALDQILGTFKPSKSTPEVLAAEHSLEIAEDVNVTAFMEQDAENLKITFDEGRHGYRLASPATQQFGAWVLGNVDTIPKKSIWG